MKHLCSHNHRLAGQDTFANQDTLNARNTLLSHLDTQVATCHHHAIGHLQNLVDIIHTLLVLNLGDNLDVAVSSIENLLDVENILFIANKRVGNEVNILLYGVLNVHAVLLRQRGEVDAYTRYVDTLAAT